MRIVPAPTPDEIAAIIAALEQRMRANATPAVQPKPSRWRMAGREYASDFKR
jgi:hypothetical protein